MARPARPPGPARCGRRGAGRGLRAHAAPRSRLLTRHGGDAVLRPPPLRDASDRLSDVPAAAPPFSRLVPFGSYAFGANLFSAVCSVLACLVLRRLLLRLGVRPPIATAFGDRVRADADLLAHVDRRRGVQPPRLVPGAGRGRAAALATDGRAARADRGERPLRRLLRQPPHDDHAASRFRVPRPRHALARAARAALRGGGLWPDRAGRAPVRLSALEVARPDDAVSRRFPSRASATSGATPRGRRSTARCLRSRRASS